MSDKIAQLIRKKIDRYPHGFVFTCNHFNVQVNNREAVIKALNRLVESGRIARLSKGRFYKPELSPFGALQPSQDEVVKDLLVQRGKVVGYLTGYSLFHDWGFTSQVSDTLQIARNQVRPALERAPYRIAFVHQKNVLVADHVRLMQVLDVIRFLNRIPDRDLALTFSRYKALLDDLTGEEVRTLSRLALKYPPATRALLGALLEELGRTETLGRLRNSLNPVSRYRLVGSESVLTFKEQWKIV